MAQSVPSWLNESFLATSLQGGEDCERKVVVTKFSANPAVPAGNNYGSCLLRVKVEFKEGNDEEIHSLSLIVKSQLTDEAQAEMFDHFKDVENIFYHQFLPLASEITEHQFAPRTYFSPIPTVMVLEDLKEQGYSMADRFTQLDFDHCRLYAVASATFHAVSVAVHKTNPELVELLGEEKLFSNKVKIADMYKTMIPQGLECMSEYMRKSEFKKYADLINESASYLWDRVVEAHTPSELLNSLNQGDPWTTNMMFKYDENNRVCQVKLLDFQALRYGSPINDLVFFLWTSANHDVRENRREEIFHIYCDTLNNKLKNLNCSESLTYDNLLEAVENLSPLMLMVVAAFVPLMVSPGVIDVGDLLPNEVDEKGDKRENKLAHYYNEDYCKRFLSRFLKQLDCMGVFKYFEKITKPH